MHHQIAMHHEVAPLQEWQMITDSMLTANGWDAILLYCRTPLPFFRALDPVHAS